MALRKWSQVESLFTPTSTTKICVLDGAEPVNALITVADLFNGYYGNITTTVQNLINTTLSTSNSALTTLINSIVSSQISSLVTNITTIDVSNVTGAVSQTTFNTYVNSGSLMTTAEKTFLDGLMTGSYFLTTAQKNVLNDLSIDSSGNLVVGGNLIVTGTVTATNIGGSTSNYNMLTSWADYTSAKTDWVVSAPLLDALYNNVQTLNITVTTLVPNTRQVIAGEGLSGGGALTADVTLALNISGLTTNTITSIDYIPFYRPGGDQYKSLISSLPFLTSAQGVYTPLYSDSHSISGGGLRGGGLLTSNLYLELDIPDMALYSGVVDPVNDYISIYDASTLLHKKIPIGLISGTSTVQIIAGEGLVGGGILNTDRTLSLNIGGLIDISSVSSAIEATDYIPFYRPGGITGEYQYRGLLSSIGSVISSYTGWNFQSQDSTGTQIGIQSIVMGGNASIKAGTNVTLSQSAGIITINAATTGTAYTGGTGIVVTGTTINHTNAITAQLTQALYKITVDAQGHITNYSPAITTLSNPYALTVQFDSGTTVGTDKYIYDGSAVIGLNILSGGAITLTKSTGAISIAHADTSSITNLTSAANIFVNAITFDTYGHVQTLGTTVVDFTVSANNAYRIANISTDSGYTWGIVNTAGAQNAITNASTLILVPGTKINMYTNTVSGTDAIKIEHQATTRTDTTSTSSSGSFTAVDSVTTDSTGHITAINVKTVTLAGASNAWWNLTDGTNTATPNSTTSTFTFASDGSLGVLVDATNRKVTYIHSDTSSVLNLTAFTNTFIAGQTYDTYGHILTTTTGTIDFTVSSNYAYKIFAIGLDSGYTWGTINTNSNQVATSSSDSLTFIKGTAIDLYDSIISGTHAIKIAHGGTSTLSGAYGTSGIASITVDVMGHITAITTATYGTGTVTNFSFVNANGISGSVTNPTTVPTLTLTLGAITPTSVNGVSATTISYLDATSSIQTQINGKIGLSNLSGTLPILYSAGVISHSAIDGYLHVPITSTTNNGKVLTAGATAGSLSWQTPVAQVQPDWNATTGLGTILNKPTIFTGSGTAGYLPKWTGSTAFGNSPFYTDGTNIGFGTTTLTHNLEILGTTATPVQIKGVSGGGWIIGEGVFSTPTGAALWASGLTPSSTNYSIAAWSIGILNLNIPTSGYGINLGIGGTSMFGLTVNGGIFLGNGYFFGGNNTTLGAGKMIIQNGFGSGVTLPLAYGHFAGSASGTGIPGLILNPGTILTTTVSGAVENTGTHLYWTNSTGTRFQLDQQAGGIALSSLSATPPLAYNNTTGVFSIQQATGSLDGFLSSTDWNTFNNKGSGTVTSVSGLNANGLTWNVLYPTLTPVLELTLGAITPTSVCGVSATTLSYVDATSSIQTQLNSKGSVTSVGLAMPTGFTVTNSPITGSGTLSVTLSSGYYLPTTTDQSNWNAKGSGTVTSIATIGAISGGTITTTGTISHLTSDGYLHVLATGTTNNGKALIAGTTAGSLSWGTPWTGLGYITAATLSVTTTGTSGAATFNSTTGVFNIPNYGANIPTGTGLATVSSGAWGTTLAGTVSGQMLYYDGSNWVGSSSGLLKYSETSGVGTLSMDAGQSIGGQGVQTRIIGGNAGFQGYGITLWRSASAAGAYNRPDIGGIEGSSGYKLILGRSPFISDIIIGDGGYSGVSGPGDGRSGTANAFIRFVNYSQGTSVFTSSGLIKSIAHGTAGQVWTSGGPLSDPSWTTVSGGSYSLPTASASVLGGIKIGSGLSVDGTGIVSTTYSYSLPTASALVLGGIKVGTGLSIDGSGILSATGGGSYSLPTMDASTLGGAKLGSYLAMSGSPAQTLSVAVTGSPYGNGSILYIGGTNSFNVDGSNFWYDPSYSTIHAGRLILSSTVDVSISAPGISTFGRMAVTSAAPSSSSVAGVIGEIRGDSNYLYFCYSAFAWKRVALSSF